MSSFAGRMKEYQTISIDRFDRENLHARAYFLSHCHKDHMKGLKGPFLKRKLERSLTVKLYCSFVTRELLLSNPKYGFWEGHIEALEIDSPTHIPLIDEVTGESDHVVVTLLPAGHCPGSVMFLFEGAQGTVLYTGDFRLAIGDASRMEYLHSGDRVKDILSVYLDSTFYEPRYYQIPSRETCLNGIRNLVQDWICQSPYHVVWFNCKAAYGYEYLFTNLGQEFNSQIHVNSLDMFLKMPEILCHMTTDRETQIHACRHPRDDEMFRANRLPCGSTARDGTPLRIISIKPSTIWFGERTRKTNVIVRVGASSFRACFSFHSSYSEINDFLSYIRPVNIYPSVIPIGCSLEDATELLKPMCRKPSLGAEMVYKPLGMLKRTRKEPILHDSDSDEELFGEVAVVPKRRKLPFKEIVAEPQDQKKTPVIQGTVDVLPEPRPSVHASNYFDCTESNDDDDDDDEEEENKQLPKPKPEDTLSSGDAPSALPVSQTATPCRKPIPPSSHVAPPHADPAPPCWNSFFTAEPVLTDESCELDSSQRSQSQSQAQSTDHTCSQSPELFRDEDEDEDEEDDDDDGDGDDNGTCGHDDDGYIILSSSQSTNISDTVGESCSQSDTVIIMEEERNNVQPSSQSSTKANGELVGGALNDSSNSQSEPPEGAEHISDSQVSSDFELPSTPGSETPSPQELNELYRKLAAGQEVVVRRGQQRRV